MELHCSGCETLRHSIRNTKFLSRLHAACKSLFEASFKASFIVDYSAVIVTWWGRLHKPPATEAEGLVTSWIHHTNHFSNSFINHYFVRLVIHM